MTNFYTLSNNTSLLGLCLHQTPCVFQSLLIREIQITIIVSIHLQNFLILDNDQNSKLDLKLSHF